MVGKKKNATEMRREPARLQSMQDCHHWVAACLPASSKVTENEAVTYAQCPRPRGALHARFFALFLHFQVHLHDERACARAVLASRNGQNISMVCVTFEFSHSFLTTFLTISIFDKFHINHYM